MLLLRFSALPAAVRWTRIISQNRVFLIGLVLVVHIALLLIAYTVLYTFGLVEQLPTSEKLIRWDVGLYYQVAQTGYSDATSGINAFFPLLPVVWRLTGLSAIGISLLNSICSCIGMGIIAWAFHLSARQLFVALSGPMLFFTMVPYSEALFILWGAFLLAGLHRHQYWLVLTGLLGACLTRSAATLFIPAYLFAELLWWGQHSWYKSLFRLTAGVLAIISAVGLVMIVQYRSHGDAWAFYKVHSLWQHTFRLPEFPLHSSAGIDVLWLDAFALLVAMCSLLGCLLLGSRWLTSIITKKYKGAGFPSKAVLFSLGYCVGAGFFILFYQGGDLVGLARYILATPFFVVLLWHTWNQPLQQKRWLVAAVLGIGLVIMWGLGGLGQFNSFYPRQAAGYFTLLLLYIVAYVAVTSGVVPWYRELTAGLYIVNMLFIIYFHLLFSQGVWIN